MFDLMDDVGDMIGSSARNLANYFRGREAISTTKYQAILHSLKKPEILLQISETVDTEILKEFKNDGSIGDNPFELMALTPKGDKK